MSDFYSETLSSFYILSQEKYNSYRVDNLHQGGTVSQIICLLSLIHIPYNNWRRLQLLLHVQRETNKSQEV